jgi:hypothetical protein
MATQTERHTGVQDKPEIDAPAPTIAQAKPINTHFVSPTALKNERIFKTYQHFGPWFGTKENPAVFTESEFRKVVLIPKAAVDSGSIDPETFHNDLINSRKALGIIVEAPELQPKPTPVGPENTTAPTMKNAGIAESTQSIIDARKIESSVGQVDLVAARVAAGQTSEEAKSASMEPIVREKGAIDPSKVK